jgi:F420-non-reducing hydrogenase iron-sulfur subunit
VRSTLETFGLDPDRVWFRFISASEGKLFAQTVDEFVKKLKELGPNPNRKLWEI